MVAIAAGELGVGGKDVELMWSLGSDLFRSLSYIYLYIFIRIDVNVASGDEIQRILNQDMIDAL